MDKIKNEINIKSIVPGVSTSSCESRNGVIDTRHSSLTSFNDYLDSKQAALYLKISEASLRNLCSNGQVVYYKLGRRNRFLRKDLDSLMSRVSGKDIRYGN